MNQLKIGKYISKKRKENKLTQEQLAKNLGVSNKTISKWENGKCMPDYNIIQNLCDELKIGISELMDGEDSNSNKVQMFDNTQIIDLLKRTQELEFQKRVIFGVLLIVMGIALLAVSKTFGGSNFKDFISGILLGLSVVEMLGGIFYIGKVIVNK